MDPNAALDREDMLALQSGDEGALNRLIERHGPALLRYLQRLLDKEADAADVAQETFVRVYRQRDRFDPDLRFSTWLFTIASNLARNQIRWRVRRGEESLEANEDDTDAWEERLPAPAACPSERMMEGERTAVVRRAVDELPERMRSAVLLVDLEDHSVRETADILGVPPRTVESRLLHGRRILRRKLRSLLETLGLRKAAREEVTA